MRIALQQSCAEQHYFILFHNADKYNTFTLFHNADCPPISKTSFDQNTNGTTSQDYTLYYRSIPNKKYKVITTILISQFLPGLHRNILQISSIAVSLVPEVSSFILHSKRKKKNTNSYSLSRWHIVKVHYICICQFDKEINNLQNIVSSMCLC